MTRKPADGSTPVEKLEAMKDELSDHISDLENLINEYEGLGDYFNEIFRNGLYAALNAAQIAYDELCDDIDSIDEDDVLGEDEE